MLEFDEEEYLRRYDDVKKAVTAKIFSSGRQHFDLYGEKEGRWPAPSRLEKIFFGIDSAAPGLEIGAGFNPLISGSNAKVADHLDQDGLIAKYQGHGVDLSKIKPVDYVWTGEPLANLIGETFDWVAASHVIEHIPDLIGFLKGCEQILNPGGVVTLVVPDRRFTFDYFRPPSGLGSIIDAHTERRTKPSIGAVTEHYRQHCGTSTGYAWGQDLTEEPKFYDDVTAAKLAEHAAGAYVDTHVWVFTPQRFRMLMLDLLELGYTRLRESRFFPAVGCEFFIQLAVDGRGPGLSRQELAAAAVREAVYKA